MNPFILVMIMSLIILAGCTTVQQPPTIVSTYTFPQIELPPVEVTVIINDTTLTEVHPQAQIPPKVVVNAPVAEKVCVPYGAIELMNAVPFDYGDGTQYNVTTWTDTMEGMLLDIEKRLLLAKQEYDKCLATK